MAACGDKVAGTCVGVATPGIELHVRDAVTRRNLDTVATVTISLLRDRSRTLSGQPWVAVIITSDTPGDYEVRASSPGYEPVARTVTVPASTRACESVITQAVTIDLTASK